MAAAAREINEESFEQDVLKSAQPVMVDFWAPRCGPCRILAPLIDEIANQYLGKVKVFKMDVDSNNTMTSRYGLRSIPTLLVFKNGQVQEQLVGLVSKEKIEQTLNKHIAN